MINEIKILKDHGIQYIKDLRNVTLTPLFRGRPILSTNVSQANEEALVKLCPSSAIGRNPFSIDLGKCIFCRECEFAYPEAIRFTNDFRIATNRRENLIVKAGEDTPIKVDTGLIRPEITRCLSKSLKLRQVSAGGDNSCEMELNAAGNVNFDMGRMGIEFVASPRHADGVVITGPITFNMSEALNICYDATPEPKIVVLVGSEAISGGLYANSPAIDRSFLENVQVDLFVPGNPAHPLTFINGLMDMLLIDNSSSEEK